MKKQCNCCGRLISPHEANTDVQHMICATCYQCSYTRCSTSSMMIHKEDSGTVLSARTNGIVQ